VSGPSIQHLEQIAAARQSGRKIQRAATLAKISGVSLAIFAALTIVGGVTESSAILLGMGMAVAAHFELRGSRQLRRLIPAAPGRLALNQLFLGCVLVAYAGYQLYRVGHDPGPLSAQSDDPQVSQMLGSFDDIARDISMIVYAVVLLVGIVVPAMTAIYYRSIRRRIAAFVQETPTWIIQLNRKGINV
jgi:hypothetical protein